MFKGISLSAFTSIPAQKKIATNIWQRLNGKTATDVTDVVTRKVSKAKENGIEDVSDANTMNQ